MSKEVKFTVMLTPGDRYRHHHVRVKGIVTSFRIQYETKVAGKWRPAVRYDTRHGFAHRDLLDKRGRARKTPLFTQGYNETLTFAEHDIKANWRSYKRQFLREDENEAQAS
ncbi:hypothetical protein HYR54_10050 [Candidatus Acetothermia bacterium]|nr:hypothetical protein [Candidatus Acetothermia bacterium]